VLCLAVLSEFRPHFLQGKQPNFPHPASNKIRDPG
jgi:hypothetical protein